VRPSRRVTVAWKVAASVVGALVLVWGTLQVVAQLAHEERTTTTEYGAAGLRALDVQVDSGSITVVGTASDTVTVTAHVSDGLRATSERQTVDGDRLVLRGDCPVFVSNFCDVSYTIEVPAGLAVRARSDDDDIRLNGVEGDVDARTGNGSVTVRGSGAGRLVLGSDNGGVTAVDVRAAQLDAHSDNGDVVVSFRRPPSTVVATSDNGDVQVELPDDATGYAVEVHSDNGSTATSIRTDPSADRTVTARSDNGDVLVTYPTP
jgi:hypothetical protein